MIIHKLSAQEAQKIAAGEVVERPANIVKELIENSLDAGATHITITLEQGGKKLINITDNGYGMLTQDARICFQRHTTSKLQSFDELESVNTFGFRGEALASICCVAQVTLKTKHKSSDEGLQITLDQGVIVKEQLIALQHGTTINIADLFYNVPARKKFLKTTTTEWNHNATLFKAFCFSNLNVHFTLLHDGSTVYNCPPVNTIEKRIAQLFDTQVSNHTIALTTSTQKDITVVGAITGPHYSRYDRGGMFFFVNGRWIKNYKLATAVAKGYLNVLQPGKHPIAVISITVDPKTIDINIHPKKEEVQFLHPRIVETTLTQAVKTTLEQHLSTQLNQTVTFASEPAFTSFSEPYQQAPKRSVFPDLSTLPFPTSSDTIDAQQPIESFTQHEVESYPYRLIGQFKNTYLLLEHPDGLFVIDQHAAHERVLYEQFCDRFKSQETIALLFPQVITLSSDDYDTLTPHMQLFIDHGIELEAFGEHQVTIKSTPVYAKHIDMIELIKEVLGTVRRSDATDKDAFFKSITERLRAQMACKAAVKAGDVLSTEKMEQLLRDLNKTTNRFSCPHGRPTSWLLDTLSIEKKFKRKL
ncbi:MAG: DNA mismatch repair protein MutL [Alteromonas naphthalenivorans]|jgi:DNA mismatch repair protein MutL